MAYAFRHSYAQRHADNGTPVEVLRELMGHANMVTTQGYYRVRQERAPQAVQTLAPLQIDRHGNRTMPVVQQLLESERLRREVGQIAVPLGLCTEPSNVKARGGVRLPLPVRRLRALPHRSLQSGRAARVPAPAARRL